MSSLDPELAPRAEAELKALGVPVAFLLQRWLRGLASGSVPPWEVRLLLGAPHDPPWQWARYVQDIVVVFRFLSDAELVARSTQDPQLLIARITSKGGLTQAATELFHDAA